MDDIDLSGLSVEALRGLAARATKLAEDLKGRRPSYELALEAGVRDVGYNTVANGWVSSYAGEAVVTMDDGSRWKCVGRRPRGNEYFINRQGFIEMIPLEVPDATN